MIHEYHYRIFFKYKIKSKIYIFDFILLDLVVMSEINDRPRRFKQVMQFIFILGVCTNICIISLFIYVSAYEVLFSPITGAIVFLICYWLLTIDLLSVKQVFMITAYLVAFEVVLHTYYLGWDTGFIYYLYAISLVFLLDYTWKLKSVILFSGSIIGLTIATAYMCKGKAAIYYMPKNYIDNLNFFNQSIIGIVILTITIYFSYTSKKKDKKLYSANIELELQNKEILEQRNHLQILLKEVHHRVKNNLQIISSLLSLQSRSVVNKDVLEILNKSQKRVEAIALIHQNLFENNKGNEVDFKSYLNELIISHELTELNIKSRVKLEASNLNLDVAIPLGLIISEMISNAIKHAFKGISDPQINISFLKCSERFELIFKDNGVGLPNGFNLDQSGTLGLEIITALIEQIDAKISFKNDNGALFKISFLVR